MDITFDGCRKVGVAGLAAVAGCVLASGDAEAIVIAVTDTGLQVIEAGEQIPIDQLIEGDDDQAETSLPVDQLRRR